MNQIRQMILNYIKSCTDKEFIEQVYQVAHIQNKRIRLADYLEEMEEV